MDKKSLLSVHLAVLLFGTSGVFIKIIPMSALLLTLGRGIFSALALYAFIHFREYSLRLERLRDYFWNLLAGIFLAMHWFFIYYVNPDLNCFNWNHYLCYLPFICCVFRTICL